MYIDALKIFWQMKCILMVCMKIDHMTFERVVLPYLGMEWRFHGDDPHF